MTRTAQSRGPGRSRVSPLTAVSHAKTAPEEDGAEAAAVNDDDVPAGPPPTDALSEMLAGLQGAANSRISIYRIVKNQPPSYVAECDPTSFSLDDLRDKYRGGEFRLYIMKDGRLWKNMRVFVEPPHTPDSTPGAPSSSGMSDVLAVMRDGFAAQAAAMREVAANRSGSILGGADLPAIITAISGAIVALRPPPAPLPPPPPDTSDRAVDMLMRGIELAMGLRESAAPADNSIGGMLREVLKSPLMAQAVQAASTSPPALPRPNPQQKPTQPPTPAAPATSPPPTEGSQVNVFHHYYSILCQKAAEGADPTLYAELVLDNVDDDTLNTLLSKQPTPLDALIAEYPPAAAHRDWFAALIETMMSAVTEEVQDDSASSPTPSPNPTVNGVNDDASHALSAVVPGQPS